MTSVITGIRSSIGVRELTAERNLNVTEYDGCESIVTPIVLVHVVRERDTREVLKPAPRCPPPVPFVLDIHP